MCLFKPKLIKEYDMVELTVEKERYSECGIHKGAIGCVMDDKAVRDDIEVDFLGLMRMAIIAENACPQI